MRKTCILLFIALSLNTFGQITEITTKDFGSKAIWDIQFEQLEKLGTCYSYYNTIDSTFTFFDLDWKQIQKTQSPTNDLSYFMYVTQNLFDTDDGIEFMIFDRIYSKADSYYTKIIDDDGTTLKEFQYCYPLVDYMTDHFSAIRTVGDKTYLTLMNMVDSTYKVYSLPGKLQSCCNCPSDPNTSNLKVYEVSGSSSLKSYPNPVDKNVTVEFSLPVAVDKANLLLTNSEGKLITSFDVAEGETQLTIDASELKPGIYFWYLTKLNGDMISSKRIIKVY